MNLEIEATFLEVDKDEIRQKLQQLGCLLYTLDVYKRQIDTWPWIPTYIEIEGPSPEAVASTANQLGYDIKDSVIGSVDEVYKLYYDVSSEYINEQLSEFKFVDAPRELTNKLRQVPLAPAKTRANPHV